MRLTYIGSTASLVLFAVAAIAQANDASVTNLAGSTSNGVLKAQIAVLEA